MTAAALLDSVLPAVARPPAGTTGAPPPPPPPAAASPASPARIELPGHDLAAVLALQEELGIGPVLARVLVGRGLADPHAAREFLHPRERHDPSRFGGIEHATELILGHLRRESRIVVHGDYDVDGVCATAIMITALRGLGADVHWFLPSRAEDGYGLSRATVERLANRGAKLLITVDCGITAVEEVAHARALGLDVVVTDHHAPALDGRLPDCAIVHPGICGYPCPDLCGTAVAFKLAQALGAPSLERELELVALATVADLMPLRAESRRLVREGITAMANTTRPGLRALMAVSRTDPSELDASALGFRLAPRINAAGRLRRPDAALELLLTGESERAKEIAVELDTVNAERRAVEQRILWEAEEQVARLGPRSAYVLAGEEWHPGVIGIVASRIVERFHRPAILIASGRAGPAQGSGRSIPGFDLLAGLHTVAQHTIRYGGHRAAAGLTILPERIPALREAFEAHAESVLTEELLARVARVDAVVCGSELDLDLAEELSLLEPCGMGNPGVRVMVPGARFGDSRKMGEGRHVRFSVSSGGARARAVAFGCDGQVPGGEDQPLDAVFTVGRNVWNGAVETQLVLKHTQPLAPAPITILGQEDYLKPALTELDREPDAPGGGTLPAAISFATVLAARGAGRTLLDRRARSPLAVLADAGCGGGSVLALCAEVPRRVSGLQERAGGFTIVDYPTLLADPGLADPFAHLVVLDPPPGPEEALVLGVGRGFTHLAWGEPELRFVQQMYDSHSELRVALGTLYRRLRTSSGSGAREVEAALRGDGRFPLPSRYAGALLRVLVELGLVEVNRQSQAVTLTGGQRTELERSSAYRAHTQRNEDARRWLSQPDLLPAG